MNYKLRSLFLIVFFFPHFIFAQQESKLISRGASPVRVASDFKFTEGPAADHQGNVFFYRSAE